MGPWIAPGCAKGQGERRLFGSNWARPPHHPLSRRMGRRESKDLETDESSAVAELIRSAADEYYHANRNVAIIVL